MVIEKRGPSRIIFNIFNYAFFGIFAFLCLLPVWHVLMASFSNPRLLLGSSGIVWWPIGKMTVDGYRRVMQNHWIWLGYGNTILYVAFSAIVGTLFTALAGFLISRKRFKLATPLTLFILFTMMFNGGLIPTYMVIRSLGMLNTRWAVMIPGLINAFYILVMKNAFQQLPDSIEEAAYIDGASPLTTLIKILLPLIVPTLAVIAMFAVVMQWNSWYPASVYQPFARDKWPLQMFIREMLIQNDMSSVIDSTGMQGQNAENAMVGNLVKYCVTIVGTLPVLAAYPFAQKYFVTGIVLGGVKE